MNFFGQNPRFKSGEIIYREGGRLGPRIQHNLQLIYVYHGHLHVRSGEGRRVVNAGESALLLPGKEEYFTFSSLPTCHHGWVEVLRPRLEPPVLERYDRLREAVPVTSRMRELAGMIGQLREAESGAAFHLHQTLAQAIFFEFLHRAGFSEEEERLPEAVERALSRIARDFGKALTLAELAAAGGVTAQHLGRLFRRNVRQSPIEYLWAFRVREGFRLLAETGLNISEIADRCGFRTPFHFSRLIKRQYGCSPRELRKRYWKDHKVHADRTGE